MKGLSKDHLLGFEQEIIVGQNSRLNVAHCLNDVPHVLRVVLYGHVGRKSCHLANVVDVLRRVVLRGWRKSFEDSSDRLNAVLSVIASQQSETCSQTKKD